MQCQQSGSPTRLLHLSKKSHPAANPVARIRPVNSLPLSTHSTGQLGRFFSIYICCYCSSSMFCLNHSSEICKKSPNQPRVPYFWVPLCLHGGHSCYQLQGKPEPALHDEASTSTPPLPSPQTPPSPSHFCHCYDGWSCSSQVGKQNKMFVQATRHSKWRKCSSIWVVDSYY